MGKLDILHNQKRHLWVEQSAVSQPLSWMPLHGIDLAKEYGFERHRRTYTCPVEFADNAHSRPSFLENLLGDG